MTSPHSEPSPVAPFCSSCFGTDTACERHPRMAGEPAASTVDPPGDLLAAIRECVEDYQATSRLAGGPIEVDVPVEVWKAASRHEVEQLCAAGFEFRVLCRTCASTGFVCKNHPDQPWEHIAGYGCGCGNGRPCGVCNSPWKPTAVHSCRQPGSHRAPAETRSNTSSSRGVTMDFGRALAALKGGSKVQRAGWNGRDMFVVHQKGYPDGIPINQNTAEATGIPEGTVCSFRPYLMMRTADGEFVPWVASQSDLLAEDWREV